MGDNHATEGEWVEDWTNDDEGEDVFNILVTGFGPFRDEYPINPSWEIANTLPDSYDYEYKTSNDSEGETKTKKINIIIYPKAIKVSYDVVREIVPKLWDGTALFEAQQELTLLNKKGSSKKGSGSSGNKRGEKGKAKKIDFCLHIGMAGGFNYYHVEKRALKKGYRLGDVDGKLSNIGEDGKRLVDPSEVGQGSKARKVKEAVQRNANGEGKQVGDDWTNVPEVLQSDVDAEDIHTRWKELVPGKDLRTSTDAGRYLCEYIYYSSLAHLWKKGEQRRVLFLHVPSSSGEEDLQRGREVVEGLIKSIVASYIEGKSGKE